MRCFRPLRAHGALVLGLVVLGPAILGSAMLGGCDGRTDTRGSDPAAQRPVLPEGEYVVTEVTEDGRPHPLVEGSHMTIRLRKGNVAVRAGCNHLFGDYELEGDRLTVGPIGGTEMGCPKPLMEQDVWIVGVLSEPLTVAENPLTLTSGTVVFTLEWQGPNRPPAVDPDGSTSSTDGPEGVTIP